MADTLTLPRPDDWHVHLRDGALLRSVAGYTAAQFARAIVMPNLTPPVTTPAAARAYRDRILAALPQGADFQPLMTAYMVDHIDPDVLAEGFQDGSWVAAKLYPAHATTNSAHGVTDIAHIEPALARMAEIGMPLLVHGEVTHDGVDIFDREAVFIEAVLKPLKDRHPDLRVVFEHVTTRQAVEFVRQAGPTVGATITAHHLVINRSDIFRGGIRPHLYCLPIAKREEHRLALREAATSGHPGFFLGTDTAPHRITDKEAACGCAGIFSAPTALEIYAQVFEEEGALDQLELFASRNGPSFYRMPVNAGTVTLRKAPLLVPEMVAVPDEGSAIMPFLAGETLRWSLAAQH
jgi:dihydroorotase